MLPLCRCPRAGNTEQHIGGHAEERGEPGHEHDGEPEPAGLVVGEDLLRDAAMGDDGLLGEACLQAQLGKAAAAPAAAPCLASWRRPM